jgi:ATP-binding cassette subfamily B (MDR/TAP) protein 1
MEAKFLLQKENNGQQAPLTQLFRYASPWELVQFSLAVLCAAAAGVAIPIFCYNLGQVLESLTDASNNSVSDAWIRNKIARGHTRGELKDLLRTELSSENSFYMDVLETVEVMLVLGGASFLLAWAGLVLIIRVSLSQANGFRKAYLEALLKKPIDYYETNKPGSVCTSLDNECRSIEAATGEKLFILMYTAFYISSGLMLGAYYHLQLALVALSQVPITGSGSLLLANSMARLVNIKQTVLKESGGLAEETLLELRQVQAMNAQAPLINKYREVLEKPASSLILLGSLTGLGWGLIMGGGNFAGAITSLVGSMMIDNDTENWTNQQEIEPFHVAVIFCAITLCCASLGNLMPCFQGVIEGKIAAHVIISAIDGETEPGGELEHQLCGGLEIKDLSFRYPSKPDQEVLTSLSLSVSAGQTAALVGESGSGKSTVMALLLSYYAPTQGSISFDGVNSAKLSLKSLRSQMSLVSQEPLLFNLSIRENIRLGNLSATPSEILRAAEQTGVLGYAAKLPKGLDTLVGAKGSFLSGGQKQRIAIARALLKDPRILLLDEATSSLDNKTEALISETLRRLGKDRTTIMVAQRLKTVVHADQILVMRGGRLVEQGCHSDLMSIEGGVYQGMFRKQNPSTKVEVEAKLEDLELSAPQVPTKDLSLRRKHKALSFLKLFKGTWLVFGLGSFFCVCAGLSFPAFGYYIGEAIYYVCAEDGDDMLDEVYQASIALLVVSLVTVSAIAINNLCLCYVATKFLIKVRQSAFASMLHYDQAYMDSSPTRISRLTTILTVQAEKLYALGGPIVGVFLIVVASLVCGAILNMWLNWDLGIVVTAVLPLMVLGLLRGFVQLTSLTNVDYASNFSLASDVFLNVK